MNFRTNVYDFFDDRGKLFKQYYPDYNQVPDLVKAASNKVSQNNPNQDFALVLIDGDTVMKKFATVDPGHTFLSSLYFLNTYRDLPAVAQKVAAANLVKACEHHQIEPTDLMHELAGDSPDSNIVDITDLRPEPVKIKDREPVHYAIERADGSRYFPLEETAESVKAADQYFQRHVGEFVPRERREFAVKVAGIAAKAKFPLSEELEHYASQEYNPKLWGYLTVRDSFLMDMDDQVVRRAALQKLAAKTSKLAPDAFADELADFDRATGLDALWDQEVPDPWYSTVGLPEKRAQAWDVSDEAIERVSAHFGEAFAHAFAQDPATQFEAAPLPAKKILASLASGS